MKGLKLILLVSIVFKSFPLWAQDCGGYSFLCDGLDDYAETNDNPFSNADLIQGSMAAWFKINGNPEQGVQVFSLEGFVNLAMNDDGFVVGCSDGLCSVATSQSSLADDSWHFGVVSWTADETSLFIDGVLQETIDAGQSPNVDAYAERGLNVGRHAGGGDYWPGLVDEISIWSVPMDESTVQDLMENCPDVADDNLMGYWPINNDQPELDVVGGNHLLPFDGIGYSLEYAPTACNEVGQIGQDYCGPGTYWDDEQQLCLPEETCEYDFNGDGFVNMNDLLEFLTAFGEPCE